MIVDETKKIIWVRQSWLGTAFRCFERGRLSITLPEWDQGSDATHLGTAVHYGIEQYLREAISLDDLESSALAYEESTRPSEMAWKKMEDYRHLQRNLRNDLAAFREHIAPHVPLGGRAEQSFAFLTDLVVEGYTIGFKGTVDYMADGELWDWKTSSGQYKPWEKQRQEIQPSVYAFAAVSGALGEHFEYPVRFNYGVMQHMAKTSRPQIVTVVRHESHTLWMLDRVEDVVRAALTLGFDQRWMRNDTNFLCSEKWCPWWSICKGSRIPDSEDRYPQQIDLGVK